MVFCNDYAVRMLEASVPAGIEAPLRFYLTENADGNTTLSWRTRLAVVRRRAARYLGGRLRPRFGL